MGWWWSLLCIIFIQGLRFCHLEQFYSCRKGQMGDCTLALRWSQMGVIHICSCSCVTGQSKSYGHSQLGGGEEVQFYSVPEKVNQK